MPLALLAFRLRSRLGCQKQVVIGDGGRSAKYMLRYLSTHILVVLFILLTPFLSLAGGSFSIDRVLPLIQQNSDLYHFVNSTLDLDRGGWATRIGSHVNEALGGARIAPYSIRAKPKGSSGPWIFYLMIEADTDFLDAQGKSVSLGEGKTIKETLTGIKLISIPEPERN